MKEVVDKIFNQVVGIVLEGLDSKFQDKAKNNYYNLLLSSYSNYDQELKENDLGIKVDTINYDKIYSSLIQLETMKWKNVPVGVKKHVLFEDVALNEIIDITSKAFKDAKTRITEGKIVSEEETNKSLSRLTELLEQVEDYNKDLATWYVSEGSMDLRYSSGTTELTSLRIGRIN
jgi:transcriptional regulator of heat shock response